MEPHKEVLPLDISDLLALKAELRISQTDNGPYVFCPLRRKDLKLLPEEMVRQLWIAFLIKEHKVSFRRLLVEKQIMVLGKARRFDLVLLDKKSNLHCLFEFKSFKTKLNKNIFEQLSLYNSELKVPYIIASNGLTHYAVLIDWVTSSYSYLDKIDDILV